VALLSADREAKRHVVFRRHGRRKEILERRIWANELDALTICRGYAEVQKQYALEAHDGVNQYAQRITTRRGSVMGLPGKMRMAVGVVQLERG